MKSKAGGTILSVGMTGGIACGRTTVGSILTRLGACVVDMDTVAHELMAPGGAAVGKVTQVFGTGFVNQHGGIDRKALGVLVFSDKDSRKELEAILHPMILVETEKKIETFAAARGRGIAVSDAALLVETGGYRRYERLVVVFCAPDLQLRRLMARDGLSEPDALARIEAQMPLDEKKKLADYLLDTSTTMADTGTRTRALYARLLEDLESLLDLPVRGK